MINIGVDMWGFKPVTFEEIMKKYHQWKKSSHKVIAKEEIVQTLTKENNEAIK
jgi:hypothetical protein